MIKPIAVELTVAEWIFAIHTGMLRLATGLTFELDHRINDDDVERSWLRRTLDEIVGAAGEVAVAKMIGKFYIQPFEMSRKDYPDVHQYNVRATYRDEGSLIIRPKDEETPNRVHILAIGNGQIMRVWGGIRAGDAQRLGRRMAPGGRPAAWFVSREDLPPVDELLS